jgi:chromosomal replication initiation ATPase DnaA
MSAIEDPSVRLSLFRGLVVPPAQMPGGMRRIAMAVAARHGVSLAQMRGPQRRFARARQEAFALLRATGHFSLPQIGRWFNKDHTTVLFGARAHERRTATGLAQ